LGEAETVHAQTVLLVELYMGVNQTSLPSYSISGIQKLKLWCYCCPRLF